MREWENAHRKRISLSSKTVFWHCIRFALLSHMHMHKPTSPAPCTQRPKPDADADANAPSQPSPTHGRLRNSRAQISEIARAQIERIDTGYLWSVLTPDHWCEPQSMDWLPGNTG